MSNAMTSGYEKEIAYLRALIMELQRALSLIYDISNELEVRTIAQEAITGELNVSLLNGNYGS